MPSPYTDAIMAEPTYKQFTGADNKQWSSISTASPRAMQELVIKHARKIDIWNLENTKWAGLASQSRADFDTTGIADYPRNLVQKAQASLPAKRSRPANIRASLTGSVWNVPAVLANIPLAAQTRVRQKLTPLNLRIAFVASANVNIEKMGELTAKIARAIWDYTLAGGVVTLTVFHVALVKKSRTGSIGLSVEIKIPTTDVAALSLGLSPTFLRTCAGPLMTAFSDYPSDSLYPSSTNPIPNSYYIGGVSGDAIIAANAILKQLEIT